MQSQAFQQAFSSEAQLLASTGQIIRSHLTVPGGQPKLLLTLVAAGDAGQLPPLSHRGRTGNLHTQAPYPRNHSLAAIADLTMRQAAQAAYPTACAA